MASGLLGDDDRPLAEINVVPLVDVMLVLLVMFIIAAPVFAQALRVDLPRAAAPASAEPVVATVILQADGAMELDGAPVERAALVLALGARLDEEPQLVVRLGADASVAYQEVAELLALLQRAGVQRLAFATRSP
jgi:biopolymer transport protein TolR